RPMLASPSLAGWPLPFKCNEAELSSRDATARALTFPSLNAENCSPPLRGRLPGFRSSTMINTLQLTKTTKLCFALFRDASSQSQKTQTSMITHFKSVDDYIGAQPKAVQTLLRRVRSTIRKAVPSAEEMISYNLPTYKLRARPVICFAGWKQHYSIYGATDPLVAYFKDELAPYEVNDSGTIRFPLSDPV